MARSTPAKIGIPAAAAPCTITGLTFPNTRPAKPTPRPRIIMNAQPPAIPPCTPGETNDRPPDVPPFQRMTEPGEYAVLAVQIVPRAERTHRHEDRRLDGGPEGMLTGEDVFTHAIAPVTAASAHACVVRKIGS